MALRHEQILPAVVVEIFQANSPTGTAGGQRAETAFEALVAKSTAAIVVIEAVELARQLGDDDIRAAIVRSQKLYGGYAARASVVISKERHR